MKWREIIRQKENWVFTISQIAVGGGNYLYQLWAAKTLNNVAFGAWSAWYAQFSVSLFFALWIQSLMTFRRSNIKYFSRAYAFLAFVVLGILSLITSSSGFFTASEALGWLWTLGSSAFFGMFLARRRLFLISAASLLALFAKFAMAFVFPNYEGFANAILFSNAAAFCLYLFFDQPPPEAVGLDNKAPLLLSSFFFSLVTALTPQLDLLIANEILTPEELGGFAKIALLYKAFFFLFMILAQVVVTYQVRGERFRFPPFWALAIYLLGAAGAWGLTNISLLPGVPEIWVALAMMHIISLTLLYLSTQEMAAEQRWHWPAIQAAAIALELALVHALSPNLISFFGAALAFESALLLTYFWFSRLKSPAKA